ncbi:MAG: sigma-54 dependent transcriptional regulator [Bdellovibrionaceae bacterium]|nr:sigma-54 dependent transcriptional regulator [Pseudobdellovibrionaceae bacterium]
MARNSHIVVVDDDKEMGAVLSDYLKSSGHTVHTFTSAQTALESLEKGVEFPIESVNLIITDLRMPGMDGLSFLERCRQMFPDIPVILVTAFGSIDSAIEATRRGAFHYITKPFKLSEIGLNIDRALEFREIARQNKVLRKEARSSHSFAGIIGKSAPMQAVFDLIQRVSPSTANVLIQGESGTGKELVARAIHQLGPRAKRPFVAINCTAIPDTLLESELFGHAKGSFTGAIQRKAGLFEEANGGTLFLDEIGDMDMGLQAKLLRVIQEKRIRAVGDNQDRPVDVRLIAATHKDLKSAIREGRFREDLYYRLSVIPILIPPLRHRPEDIPFLAHHFLEKYSALNGAKVTGFSREAMNVLVSLPWEGNVRELENVIERAVVLCRGSQIEVSDLPKGDRTTVESLFGQMSEELPTLYDFEKRYIRFVLDKTGGRKERAANILGINRRTLYRKEREYGWVEVNPEHEESEEDS